LIVGGRLASLFVRDGETVDDQDRRPPAGFVPRRRRAVVIFLGPGLARGVERIGRQRQQAGRQGMGPVGIVKTGKEGSKGTL